MPSIEEAGKIVGGRPTRDVLTETGFFVALWRDFPSLSREMNGMVERRQATGRIKPGDEYLWIVGTSGQHVEGLSGPPGSTVGTRGTIGYPVVLDELLERGRVLLVAVEWDSNR